MPPMVTLRAGLLPQREGLGVFAKLDADLLEDGVRVALEQAQSLFSQNLVIGNLAGDVGNGRGRPRRACSPLGVPTTWAARARRFGLCLIHSQNSPVSADSI